MLNSELENGKIDCSPVSFHPTHITISTMDSFLISPKNQPHMGWNQSWFDWLVSGWSEREDVARGYVLVHTAVQSLTELFPQNGL